MVPQSSKLTRARTPTNFQADMPKVSKEKPTGGPKERTKQTAKKSTGAPAPDVDIGASNTVTPAAPATGKRTSTRFVKTVAAPPVVNPPNLATNMETSVVEKHNDVRSDSLSHIHKFKSCQWCLRCANGGDLYRCSYCPGVVCQDCITMPDAYTPDMKFVCISCHLTDPKTGLRKKPAPYLVRGFFEQLKYSFTLILGPGRPQ